MCVHLHVREYVYITIMCPTPRVIITRLENPIIASCVQENGAELTTHRYTIISLNSFREKL